MVTRPKDPLLTSNRAAQIKIVVTIFLIFWFSWWFYHPLDLLPADLGRHILNGKILVTKPGEASRLLHTNYYSYAAQDSTFINHHWFSGVIFYLVYRYSNFVGLGIFHILINLLTFLLFFRLAAKRGGFAIASILAIFIIPLIAERLEIRPEIFTYLCTALFITILRGVARHEYHTRALFLLLPIQLFWVNCHIYFFLGPILIGAYWLAAILKKLPTPKLVKPYTLAIFGVLLVSLINPSGWRGLIYPAQIFNHYDFRVSENQSIYYFDSNGVYFPNLLLYKIIAVLLVVMYGRLILTKRPLPSYPEFILSLFFLVFAFWAIRNLALFAYLALIALAGLVAFSLVPPVDLGDNKNLKPYSLAFVVVLLISIIISHGRIESMVNTMSLGLVEGSTNVFTFINQNNISGPMFNDYDIGSAATFYLFPRIQPFVDNRPEAYPLHFLQDSFLLPHTNFARWKDLQNKYGINLILFSLEDNAPWSKTFIDARLADPDWAVVYNDEFAIVLLHRTAQNAKIIPDYFIPPSHVKVPWRKT